MDDDMGVMNDVMMMVVMMMRWMMRWMMMNDAAHAADGGK